jgi:hypothetical protein
MFVGRDPYFPVLAFSSTTRVCLTFGWPAMQKQSENTAPLLATDHLIAFRQDRSLQLPPIALQVFA